MVLSVGREGRTKCASSDVERTIRYIRKATRAKWEGPDTVQFLVRFRSNRSRSMPTRWLLSAASTLPPSHLLFSHHKKRNCARVVRPWNFQGWHGLWRGCPTQSTLRLLLTEKILEVTWRPNQHLWNFRGWLDFIGVLITFVEVNLKIFSLEI